MAGYFGQAASYLLGSVSAAADMASDLARGWGSNIKWVSFKEGQKLAKDHNKPAMVVIHKTWCRSCKALKPRFANSREIEKLSNNFVMINLEDDEEPKNPEWKPDGGYIPRILFMDPNGNVLTEVQNDSKSQWKYFYGETGAITESMQKALEVSDNTSTGGTGIQRMNRAKRRYALYEAGRRETF